MVERAAEVRLQTKRQLVQADLNLLVGVELVADPRQFGELDVTDILCVLVRVGSTVETVLGLADPGVGVVLGVEDRGVEVELLDVTIRVIVPTRPDGTAEIEVVGDLDRHRWGGKGSQQRQRGQ
ncbi:hypothetical protein D9M71_386810 [compost metagenome]